MAIGKNLGANSQSSNDFLEPLAPINVSLSNVGTARPYDDGAISVSFAVAANSPEPTGYAITKFLASTGDEVDYVDNAAVSTLPTPSNGVYTVVIGGLGSNTTHQVRVRLTNASGSSEPTESNSVDVTTVPATMAAPTVTTPVPSASTNVAGASQDVVSWSAPNSGGSSITGYTWASSDGKYGTTTGTSVTVNQEGGTAQTYTVYATNANGNGAASPASTSITTFGFTPFSFVPFGNFGFAPFGFSPFNNFSFSPFGFSPFGNFSFSPFGNFAFTPFNFVPFGNFGFTPFNFVPFTFTPRVRAV